MPKECGGTIGGTWKTLKAAIHVNKLLTELTSHKLEHGKQTSQEFIIDWQEKLRQYEELTPLDHHFPNALKKTMLENSLQNIKCFRDVHTSEGLEAAKGRGELGYIEYLALLQNVAALNDNREESYKLRRFQPRTIKCMESCHHMGHDQYDEE